MDHQSFLGIELRPGSILAAFLGSVLLTLRRKETRPIRVITIVFSGVFLAIFFSPLVVPWLPYRSEITIEAQYSAVGAFMGIAALGVMNGLIDIGTTVIAAILRKAEEVAEEIGSEKRDD